MLSTRLQMIYDLIPYGARVVDVGCDHAYLLIELVKKKKAHTVFGIDNKEGPLAQAKHNINSEGVESEIKLILSDGLSSFDGDADTLIISGMGVETVIQILEDSLGMLNQFNQIIVQVNKNMEELRAWIAKKEFDILEEEICFDGFYYQAILFSVNSKNSYCEEEILLGPKLLQKKSSVYKEYILFQQKKLEFVLSKRRDEKLEKKLLIYRTFV